MHTVHLAQTVENDFKYAAMGLMFSVNDYTAKLSYAEQKIIDTFFETLDLSNQNDPKVNLVTYGDLMMMADMNNRWVYKGSVTTPPCDTFVYWNVLTTVYPISQKHLDQYKAQLTRGENGQLANRGNWRLIQPVDLHNVIRVSDTKLGSDLQSSNAPKYEININIYNQNAPGGNGGSCY
jgi:carbonic anhydrase